MNSDKICKCGKPAEWTDEFCQECWEKYCSDKWWEMIEHVQEAIE